MKIVLATDNQGKLKEIEAYMSHMPITLIPQSTFKAPSIEEHGLSFVENAILKARHASKCSNLPALADDSGLCVDALGGAPGIYSARYAGVGANNEDNIKKLLHAIKSLSGEDRNARFHCAIVFVRHHLDPIPIICQAEWVGRILSSPQGSAGFGYDPIFFIPHLNCAVAELEPSQKNMLSHRAKALGEFIQQFKLAYPQVNMQTPSSHS